MLDEYKNEEKENDMLLINIEELEHGKNYEELYKYIKTKLLSKLCILVLMTILEECKKEGYIEDRELHLDSSINEWNTEKNSVKKQEIEDIFIQKHINVYENGKNKDIHNNIWENFLREEIHDWIGKDETYINSIEYVWRRWISEKGKILKQYIDQNWFKELSEVNQNMLDEYKNEEKENDMLLINIEELEHGKNYEELYKYIKTKLLSKLCILVLMTILEECKKEGYIEDRELHLDSSINEWNTEKNSVKKQEIEDIFIQKHINVYENGKNKDIHNNIWENFLREEIHDWIGKDETYINSIECMNNDDKYDHIVE
ncbi:STP1 protein [Plasmodium malariae]|uniref:STP1 protein n=1 Tax=Plasmodium malariae TaxID=5858 RepID=A0A1A8WX10_PLAMA|nr:STP1 protein [Plasmodium malariae]